MALTGIDFNDLGKSGVLPTAIGQSCFYCGTRTTDPAWTWSGEVGNPIYLHVSCALNLSIRMMRDMWLYQKRADIKAVTT